jgi:hypothetical protein
MKHQWIISSFLLAIFITGCEQGALRRVASPPFGWRSPVAELLLDEGSFPNGWQIDLEFPQDHLMDPTINHVGRELWNPQKGSAGISQSIWRAYSFKDAKEKYSELRQKLLFSPRFTPSPYDFYVEFRPPSELDYKSQIADEFYMACGWVVWAYCDVVARYRNYCVELRLDLEANYQEHVRDGLTYAEIETALKVMDSKFEEFFNSQLTPIP